MPVYCLPDTAGLPERARGAWARRRTSFSEGKQLLQEMLNCCPGHRNHLTFRVKMVTTASRMLTIQKRVTIFASGIPSF